NLLAASVSNFDSIVSDNFTVSKSYDLHSKYPKRHTGTRKRKILPDERLEMDKFKLSMIKELHAYYYTIFKQGGSLMPKHLFANEEAEAIVNSFQNITSVQKLQRVIGVEAFAGQREWLFKWIDEYKESREKEMDDESSNPVIPPASLPPIHLMAPANPPDDVPSTPPNHPEEPDVPQSTRRESSRIRTPLSRPGFIPTASDSRRALIGNPTQPRRRPATTPSSDPLPDEPNKGDKEEESSDDVIETQATGQRPGTKKKPGDEACACRWCPKEV
ncbi:hypothetical protein MJO29_003927, partial [Puccinia striiformis f. sp. tritici]